ncbi:MAG: hypothetical protein ACOYZ8_09655 [Chloroflexota bacterium]
MSRNNIHPSMERQKTIGVLLSLILIIGMNCRLTIPLEIRALEPKVGTEISQQDGRLVDNTTVVPSNTKRIYYEFFLDIPENTDVLLEFRWYRNDEIIYAYSGRFIRGYTVGFIQPQEGSLGFLAGEYKVEVWFLNTMLINSSFQVK